MPQDPKWFFDPDEMRQRAAQNAAEIAHERDESIDQLNKMLDKISALTRYAIIMTLLAAVELVVIFLLAFFQ